MSMEDKVLRIKDIMRLYNLDQIGFAKATKIHKTSVSKILSGKIPCGDSVTNKIILAFPNICQRWLLTGQGPMTNASSGVVQNNFSGNNNYVLGGSVNTIGAVESDIPTLDTEEVERAPIVSATIARAPEVDILETVQEKRDELEKAPVGVFNAPVSIWYRVQDESLAPKYEIGDLIALWAYPKGKEDPIPGKLYGINTSTNGLIVRRLFPQEDGGYIARAMNREEFPDYHIKSTNVVQVYKIMLMVRF